MKLRYSRRAAHDLESIREYLSERSVRGAANVLAAIYLSIEFIRRNPQASEKTTIAGVRAKAVKKYRFKVFYRVAAPMTRLRLFTCAIRRDGRGAVRANERANEPQSLLGAMIQTGAGSARSRKFKPRPMNKTAMAAHRHSRPDSMKACM